MSETRSCHFREEDRPKNRVLKVKLFLQKEITRTNKSFSRFCNQIRLKTWTLFPSRQNCFSDEMDNKDNLEPDQEYNLFDTPPFNLKRGNNI